MVNYEHAHYMGRANGETPIETIIEGNPKREVIEAAVNLYLDRLKVFAFPPGLDRTPTLPEGVRERIYELQPIFEARVQQSAPMVADIIQEVNERAAILTSKEYRQLRAYDRSLWLPDAMANASKFDIPQFGIIACVDKGIPSESVIGVDGEMGRMLGGRVSFDYIPTLGRFVMLDSAIHKRLIHMGRQGYKLLVEPLLVHTNCGRQAQIVGNEYGEPSIPSVSFVFNHLDALVSDFPGDAETVREQFAQVRKIWESYDRVGPAVVTTDKGLYADVVAKTAQRQAVTDNEFLPTYSPVEVFNKENADIYVGVDNPDVLTDPIVLAERGYTDKAIEDLRSRGKIFSIRTYKTGLDKALARRKDIPAKGTRTYEELQHDWPTVQRELVDVTAALWQLYFSEGKEGDTIKNMVNDYLEKALYYLQAKDIPADTMELVQLRSAHHLFHVVAYTHVLDTFTRGNVPGHHIERYLVTGDKDIGTKPTVGLGQGYLERPDDSEMFTGYSVLLHSDPGHGEGFPIATILKLDTDRLGDQQVSTEESEIGREDFRQFLKLWPYFLCGDMIPVLAIRGKKHEGISRLGLSVLLAFKTMLVKLERSDSHLPAFVPANTEKGKVVLVPAEDILMAGIEAGDNLQAFRHEVQSVAKGYDKPKVQKSFRDALKK